MDHPRSWLRRFNPFKMRPGPFHRGKPHTILGAAIISVPGVWFGTHMYAMVYAGALIHIASDWIHSMYHGNKFRIKLW